MTAPDAPPPPPAWYPDPQNPSVQRWWDGGQWTDYQRPASAVSYSLPPASPMSGEEERNWLLAAHLSALPAAFVFLAFLGPLIVLLIKGGESPLVRQHAVAALNFNLSWLLYGVVLTILAVVLSLILIGFLLFPVIAIGAVAWFVIVVMASVRAGNGNPVPFAYPLTINFIK